MPGEGDGRLTSAELAREADTTPERVAELVAIGALKPADDGTFGRGDIIRSNAHRSIRACRDLPGSDRAGDRRAPDDARLRRALLSDPGAEVRPDVRQPSQRPRVTGRRSSRRSWPRWGWSNRTRNDGSRWTRRRSWRRSSRPGTCPATTWRTGPRVSPVTRRPEWPRAGSACSTSRSRGRPANWACRSTISSPGWSALAAAWPRSRTPSSRGCSGATSSG